MIEWGTSVPLNRRTIGVQTNSNQQTLVNIYTGLMAKRNESENAPSRKIAALDGKQRIVLYTSSEQLL